jgi:tetratricopeptide (TPR) repeat protein
MRIGKPETRNPKPESNPNDETRNKAVFVIRISDLIRVSGFGFLVCLLAACTGNAQSRQSLDGANQSLNASQYDQAIRATDSVLSSSDSAAYAEAWYIRGYAIEKRPKQDNAAAQRDLSLAADSYSRGLASNPRPSLAARLHAQLGNVAYYQQDYSTAVRELTAAFDTLDSSQPKDLVLYHIGIGQQRLGRFEDADQTFTRLQQIYPTSPYAARARDHQGVRGFYVQLGEYSQPADINRAAGAISAAGSVPLQTSRGGLTVIRTADVPSFAQAEELRSRLAGQYPDARVMP